MRTAIFIMMGLLIMGQINIQRELSNIKHMVEEVVCTALEMERGYND